MRNNQTNSSRLRQGHHGNYMVITTVFPMYMEIALAKEKKDQNENTYIQTDKLIFFLCNIHS